MSEQGDTSTEQHAVRDWVSTTFEAMGTQVGEGSVILEEGMASRQYHYFVDFPDSKLPQVKSQLFLVARRGTPGDPIRGIPAMFALELRQILEGHSKDGIQDGLSESVIENGIATNSDSLWLRTDLTLTELGCWHSILWDLCRDYVNLSASELEFALKCVEIAKCGFHKVFGEVSNRPDFTPLLMSLYVKAIRAEHRGNPVASLDLLPLPLYQIVGIVRKTLREREQGYPDLTQGDKDDALGDNGPWLRVPPLD